MIVIAGHPQGLISCSIADTLKALPGAKRFVAVRPVAALPLPPDVERCHVDTHIPGDVARALSGAHSLVLIGSMGRDHADLHGALAQMARAAGVEKLVLISLIGASVYSPAEVLRRLGRVEHAVRESGVPFVILRCAPFMQSLRLFMQIDGLSLALTGPFHTARFDWIDARDAGEIVVRLLCGPLDNSVKQLCGPAPLDFDDVAAIICNCAPCDCTFNDLSAPQAQGLLEGAGFTAAQARELVEYWDYIVSGVVSTTAAESAEELLGRPLRTLEECAPTFIPRGDISQSTAT